MGGNVYNNENEDGSYHNVVASVFIFNPVSVFVFVSAPSLWEGRDGVFALQCYFLNFFPTTGSELSGMSFITTIARYASMSTVLVSM